jgi:hypothetical protein
LPARLLGKAAGQGCRARLQGKAAGQGCRAKDCRARLPDKAAGQYQMTSKNLIDIFLTTKMCLNFLVYFIL